MPTVSCATLANGARQLVVHEAFEMTRHLERLMHDQLPGAVPRLRIEPFGIEHGLMTTIRAYTGDQRLQDAPHQASVGPAQQGP